MAKAKMKERPLLRRPSGYFSGARHHQRGIHPIITRPISGSPASYHLCMRIGWVHIGRPDGHAEPQLAHSMAVYFASYRTLLTRRKMLLRISCVDLALPTMIRCCTHSAFDDFAVNLLRDRSQTDLQRSAWIVCAMLRIWNLVAAIKN